MSERHFSEDDLRRRLHARANEVQPTDRLADILHAVDARSEVGAVVVPLGRRWLRWTGPLAAAAAAALVLVFVWSGQRGGTPNHPATAPPTLTPTATSSTLHSTSSGPSAASGSSPSGPGGGTTVPVYYVAEVPPQPDGTAFGPRLYREWHRVTVPEVPYATIRAALGQLWAEPLDPDYGTEAWGTMHVRAVTVQGSVATVDFDTWGGWGASFESAFVQQVIYTVTATDSSISRVRLTVNGKVPPSGHLLLTEPQSRGNSLQTLANAWILTPEQGSSVGSPTQIRVYGTGFEGNVPLRVYQGATMVWEGNVTTEMGGFAEATTSVTLPAGDYTIRAYNDSPQDGSLTEWDSKDFTVR